MVKLVAKIIWGINKSERWVFKWWRKEKILFDDITCSGSEFRRVGTATEKVQVPTWVLTLGTDSNVKSCKGLSEYRFPNLIIYEDNCWHPVLAVFSWGYTILWIVCVCVCVCVIRWTRNRATNHACFSNTDTHTHILIYICVYIILRPSHKYVTCTFSFYLNCLTIIIWLVSLCSDILCMCLFVNFLNYVLFLVVLIYLTILGKLILFHV